MSLKITHKYSTATGTPPASGDIDVGEVAINAADAELYTKDSAGNIRKFQNTTTGTADGVQFTQSGTGAMQRTVESKLRDVASVLDFIPESEHAAIKAGTSNYNATTAIQAAIDSSASEICFPAGTYNTTAPIYLGSNQVLKGESAQASAVIKKTTGTPGTGTATDVLGGTENFDKKAILILRFNSGSDVEYSQIRNLQFRDANNLNDYGIYAPFSHGMFLENVVIVGARIGWYTHLSWLTTFINVIVNCQVQGPGSTWDVGVSSGNPTWNSSLPADTPSVGFWWDDRGLGGSTGTSLKMIGCWALQTHYGYYLRNLTYSSMTTCACDFARRKAYWLSGSHMHLLGCGCEDVAEGTALHFFSGENTVVGFVGDDLTGASGKAAVIVDAATVVMQSCSFEDFLTVNGAVNIKVQNNSNLTTINCKFPSNGSTPVTLAGSTWNKIGTTVGGVSRRGFYQEIGNGNDIMLDANDHVLLFTDSTGYSTSGFKYKLNKSSQGDMAVISSGTSVAYFNRRNDDGTIVNLAQDGTVEGTISVSGTTVSYNGAHLSRWSQLPNGAERTEILRGTVLSNIDEMCKWGEEDNEQLNRMKVSDVDGDKNVSGVFQAWDDDDRTYTNDFYCAMTGDFIIRIGAGVTVERGDLLMSAGDGTAKPQDDDIIRSKTIAKVTSTNVTCTYEDGSYCVPCVLMAC